MRWVKVTLKVVEGDPCIVRNYRSKYRPWENGIVSRVRVIIDKDLTYRVSYTVILNRKSDKGKSLFLTVGDFDIDRASY